MARPWSYWTRNKLEILAGYLPAFNRASQASPERVYLDLMAGEPENVDRYTGDRFDGSPLIAMKADPRFTRLRFCELDSVATELEAALREQFRGDGRYRVVHGDCNVTIDQTLVELAPFRRAPTFAFVDQQAAEVQWDTLKKVAAYRQNRRGLKTEIWILMSPAMIVRGVKGTNAKAFIEKVTRMYGDDDWKRIQAARWRDDISPSDYRAEMVNLMRVRLQYDLGYRYSHRIPMRMPNAVDVYDMVFATDHSAGDNIMRYLYNKAAQREEGMMRQAKIAKLEKESDERGEMPLFPASELPVVDESTAGEILWQPTPTWNPGTHDWWHEEPDF
jgi:three-Cys-motif partner protein